MTKELTKNDIDALRHSLGFHNTGVWVGRDAFESLVDAWEQYDSAQRGTNEELKAVEEELESAKSDLRALKGELSEIKELCHDLAKAIEAINI